MKRLSRKPIACTTDVSYTGGEAFYEAYNSILNIVIIIISERSVVILEGSQWFHVSHNIRISQ